MAEIHDIDPVVKEKMKKNLVYVGIFSIVMMFAGFTSAYIVLMGDSFWLKYPMPTAFWISTAIIILSSITYILGIGAARKDNLGAAKGLMGLTVVLGALFAYFQFKGYGELIDKGINPFNNHIIVTDGRYGDYFEIKYKNNFVEVDGNKFLLKGKEMSEEEFNDLKNFTNQFVPAKQTKALSVKSDNNFELFLNSEPVLIKNGKLSKNDSTEFEFIDELRLSQLALNIRDKRGDFFAKGNYGEDFKIYYKGVELSYKNRKLEYQGKELSNFLQIKATETADSASAMLFIITFLHLIHVIIALIYLVTMFYRTVRGDFTSKDTLSLRLGAIFWHFLGILWLYLLLFLIFIH